VVIGKDTLLSSHMIEHTLVAGFASLGADVLLLGWCRRLRGDADALDALRSRGNIGIALDGDADQMILVDEKGA
jgi:phosphomannomutase